MLTEPEARVQVRDMGLRLLREGLVARTWGNVSVRLDDRRCVITPSGRHYEELTPEDMVVVDYVAGTYEDAIKPSSEKMVHEELYRTRRDVGAVIHTHQTNASVVAVARRELPPILDDQVQILGPTVRVADYALPSTKKMVRACVKALKGRNAALMANHGAICVGPTLDDAFVACVLLEKACKAFIEAEFLGGAKSINIFEAHLMHQYYLLKYSKRDAKKR
ncbi:MAG: class II aldolase/adducin family protein [Candidatus Hydrogenedentes bacterium]|nr:class II aldolase/adducin family protein [Candidatus Hydrogenedentota bacterium]